jgi:hypothetical protein
VDYAVLSGGDWEISLSFGNEVPFVSVLENKMKWFSLFLVSSRNISNVEKSSYQQLIATDSFCFLKVGTGFPCCVRFLGGFAEGLEKD